MNLKVFVNCKNNCMYKQDSVLQPIQVGAALTTQHMPMQLDNMGENISDKFERYQTTTSQYWAAKNIEADYIGFLNCDKYFDFNAVACHKIAKTTMGGGA